MALKLKMAPRVCWRCEAPVVRGGAEYTWDKSGRYVHLSCVPGGYAAVLAEYQQVPVIDDKES